MTSLLLLIYLEFQKWNIDLENKEKCQYVKRTSKKHNNGVEYFYYYCHRSNDSKSENKVTIFVLEISCYNHNHFSYNFLFIMFRRKRY